MCIIMSCVYSLVGMCTPKLHAIVHIMPDFGSFTCNKQAGAHMYLYLCIKFQLSSTKGTYHIIERGCFSNCPNQIFKGITLAHC